MLSFEKRPIKVRNSKPLSLFVFFLALARERIFIQTHSIERRCYRTGKYTVCKRVRAGEVMSLTPSLLWYQLTHQPGNFTGLGSERVKRKGWRDGGTPEYHLHARGPLVFFSPLCRQTSFITTRALNRQRGGIFHRKGCLRCTLPSW